LAHFDLYLLFVALSNTELGKSLAKARNYTRKVDTKGNVYG